MRRGGLPLPERPIFPSWACVGGAGSGSRVSPFVRPFGFWSFFCDFPSVGNGFPSISMPLSKFPAAGPSDLSDFESILIGNSPSGWISAILIQNGATLSQSGRLSSERDGKWNFERLCASNRNCTLQLLLKNLMVF